MTHAHEVADGVSHGHPTSGRAFGIAMAMIGVFAVVEVAAGLAARSTALTADAAHNFGDVLALGLAWGAAALGRQVPSARRTYGLRRGTILAALANAVILFVVVGGVIWAAIERLHTPVAVSAKTVIGVASLGVIVNALAALPFLAGRHHDANVRAAFLHLASDAAVSLGVVAGGALLLATQWWRIDALVTLGVSLAIVVNAWSLLRESLDLALDAVPEHVDPDSVRLYLARLPGVLEVHDLHIWGMSTTQSALTAHLVMPGDSCHPAFLSGVCRELHERFRIEHTTLQVEAPDAPAKCAAGAGRTCS